MMVSSLISTPTTKTNNSKKQPEKKVEDEEETEEPVSLSDLSELSENENDSRPVSSTSFYCDSDESIFQETDESHSSKTQELTNLLPVPGNVTLEVGDFIISKFPTAKRERLYIAKIEKIDNDELTINGLRKKGLEKGHFVYPEIQDISIIDCNQVIRKVVTECI